MWLFDTSISPTSIISSSEDFQLWDLSTSKHPDDSPQIYRPSCFSYAIMSSRCWISAAEIHCNDSIQWTKTLVFLVFNSILIYRLTSSLSIIFHFPPSIKSSVPWSGIYHLPTRTRIFIMSKFTAISFRTTNWELSILRFFDEYPVAAIQVQTIYAAVDAQHVAN